MSGEFDPKAALDSLGAIWSDDFDAYASGELDASQVHCALCQCAPCRCPAFGTPAYFALLDQRHGRTRQPEPADPGAVGEPAPVLCPGGCGCRLGTDDADRFECGCAGGCAE